MAIDHEALEGRTYRSYVGPERQYDLLGASQFRLLCALGLRSHHQVLDFGCGSLRAGRLLLPYLDTGRYFGIEPNQWLIDEAIRHEVGADLVRLRQPRFDHNADFAVDMFETRFDYILAQSIFSHCGADLVRQALANFSRALAPDGLVVATFLPGADYIGSGWLYPKCATYRPQTIEAMARDAGLVAITIPWFHPRQSWWLMASRRERLPTPQQAALLTGVVLGDDDFRASWSRAAAARKAVSRWYKYRVLAPLRQWRARRRDEDSRGV